MAEAAPPCASKRRARTFSAHRRHDIIGGGASEVKTQKVLFLLSFFAIAC
jgi:hypothetical protein